MDSDDDEIQFKSNINEGLGSFIPTKEGSIYSIAKQLMDDENVSICRTTGIMKKKNSRSRDSRSSYATKKETTCRRDRSSDRNERRTVRAPQTRNTKYTGNRSNRYKREEPWSREMNRALSTDKSGESSDGSYYTRSSSEGYVNKMKQTKKD